MLLHCPIHCAVCVALCGVIALIVELFTLAKSQRKLNARAGEIEGEGNKRKSVAADLTEELHDLLFVHQQLFGAQGIAVKDVTLLVGTYVHTVNEHLALINACKALLEVDLALTDALYLSTREYNSCIVIIEQSKIK